MGGETLALETQLLLQEATQAASRLVEAAEGAAPAPSELEAAKQALVDKLRQKKDRNKQQQQRLLQQRYGFANAAATPEDKASASASVGRATPTKAKRMVRLPVVAAAAVGPKQKKDLLAKLRTQAIHQGAQSMAKLFGYSSYEEQIKHLNKIEKLKILQSEQAEAEAKKNKPEVLGDGKEEDSSSDFVPEADEGEEPGETAQQQDEEMVEAEAEEAEEKIGEGDEPMEDVSTVTVAIPENGSNEETRDLNALAAPETSESTATSPKKARETGSPSKAVPRRRRNHVAADEDDDGNEADSEQDGDEEEDPKEAEEPEAGTQKAPRDKAAAFRQLLQQEAKQERRRKRLRQGENFVESEADEDEEEDVLKIGGLGDFGFGVPQVASKESKEAEEERNALKMREDDLEGIVDDLSDDERAQEQDLEEIYRRELEEQDRQQVKEVMRNVKEGFGRNRRAFSNLDGGLGARGRFNLNELVAADGDKLEAARLGLLESDEEMNEDDEEEGDGKKKDEEAEEEDEEAEMERMLRERFMNQPKIYITSSDSESEGENEVENDDDEAAKEEIESDEERERQQMKLFSERARINRRMQRMKDMQRQIAQEVEEESAERAALPNLLLEEDEESQELLKVLTRTDVKKIPADGATVPAQTKSAQPASSRAKTIGGARPKVGRFSSFGMGSSVRSSSSFSRVADNCKLFSAGSGATSTTTKGFVFTSFSSDKTDHTDENAAPGPDDSEMVSVPSKPSSSLAKNKSGARPGKRPFAASNNNPSGSKAKKSKSDFFSVLASYQCVSQNTASEPM